MSDDYDTTAEETFWFVVVDRATGTVESTGPWSAAEVHEAGMAAMGRPEVHTIAVSVLKESNR